MKGAPKSILVIKAQKKNALQMRLKVEIRDIVLFHGVLIVALVMLNIKLTNRLHIIVVLVAQHITIIVSLNHTLKNAAILFL